MIKVEGVHDEPNRLVVYIRTKGIKIPVSLVLISKLGFSNGVQIGSHKMGLIVVNLELDDLFPIVRVDRS
jgi:hypothetical protein